MPSPTLAVLAALGGLATCLLAFAEVLRLLGLDGPVRRWLHLPSDNFRLEDLERRVRDLEEAQVSPPTVLTVPPTVITAPAPVPPTVSTVPPTVLTDSPTVLTAADPPSPSPSFYSFPSEGGE
ncbi:hypothetical protein ACHAQJ_008715 [Trichoderma viride]